MRSSSIFIPNEWKQLNKADDVTALKGMLQSIKIDTDSLKTGLLNNSTEINSLKNSLKSNNIDMVNLKTGIQSNKSDVDNLNTALQTINTDINNLKSLFQSNIKGDLKVRDKISIPALISGSVDVIANKKFLNFYTTKQHPEINDFYAPLSYDDLFPSACYIFKRHLTNYHVEFWIQFIDNTSPAITITAYKNDNAIVNKYFTYENLRETKTEHFEFIDLFDINDKLSFSILSKTPVQCSYFLKISNLITDE
jgi:hypothetical protein